MSNYDHVALVLDDMFIPDQGLHAVDVDKMIENMAKYDIQVMSPGIVRGTWKSINNAEKEGSTYHAVLEIGRASCTA